MSDLLEQTINVAALVRGKISVGDEIGTDDAEALIRVIERLRETETAMVLHSKNLSDEINHLREQLVNEQKTTLRMVAAMLNAAQCATCFP